MVAFAASTAVAAPADKRVALVGGSVVSVENGTTLNDAVVLIEGERIVQIGPRASVVVPQDAEVVPMDGRWLIPGLMNMHVHFGLKLPGAAGAELQNETDAQQALRMAANARRSLHASSPCAAPSSVARLSVRGSKRRAS